MAFRPCSTPILPTLGLNLYLPTFRTHPFRLFEDAYRAVSPHQFPSDKITRAIPYLNFKTNSFINMIKRDTVLGTPLFRVCLGEVVAFQPDLLASSLCLSHNRTDPLLYQFYTWMNARRMSWRFFADQLYLRQRMLLSMNGERLTVLIPSIYPPVCSH